MQSQPARNRYDGIILGTGHNAMILQAYLCRCGLKVLAVDRAARYGGGLMTAENPRRPGVRQNLHSFYHRAITAMPWYRDLQLEQQGAVYLEPELNVAMVLKDGLSLQWWRDPEKTAASAGQFSVRDAKNLRKWAEEFRPILEEILIPEAQSPPLPPEKRRAWLESTALGRRLLEISALSPLQFVSREFEHPVVRAGLLFFNGLREVDLRLPGFGHAIPALLASPHKAQMCLGGSARLADALAADIRAHGGEILLHGEPQEILLRDGQAKAIRLRDGAVIEADGFIASGLNPQQTFLDLIDPALLKAGLREKAERFKYNLLAPLFAVHLVLSKPVQYAATARSPELARAFMVILGLDDAAQFQAIVDAHESGAIPPPVTWGSSPTNFDPSQAPPGLHTAFMWEKTPYRLQGNPERWEEAKEAHGRALIEHWEKYAPGLESSIVDRFYQTPVDTEQVLPNMREGDLLVGAFASGQVGYDRPFPGAGQYRTPLPGLYLCGGSTHPGGNITGLCGYNAAQVIASDLGLKRWWPLAARRFGLD